MYTEKEVKEFITGLRMVKKAMGYGAIVGGGYGISIYKGKYGEGYTVHKNHFLAKDGNFYHTVYYYVK